MFITTEHLIIKELSTEFFDEYYHSFTARVTKYQYPDPFDSIESANDVLSGFIEDMNAGKMYELVILNKNNEFIGSIEAFSIDEDIPEIGIWIKEDHQHMGYGYEALRAFVNTMFMQNEYKSLLYEADIRNHSSIALVEKFVNERGAFEELAPPSGKLLQLQSFYILKQD